MRARAFLLFAAIAAVTAIYSTTVRTDIKDFFFTETLDRDVRIGQIQTEEIARRYLISVSHANVDKITALDFVTTLRLWLSESPDVTRAWTTPFSYQEVQQLLRTYSPHQLQLLFLQPEDQVQQLLDYSSLTKQAARIREALLGTDSALVKSLLADDPMLLTLSWLDHINQFYQQPESNLANSTFVLETQHPGLDTAVHKVFQQFLRHTFSKLNTQFENRFTLEITGVPVFAVSIRDQVSRDITRVSSLSIAIVALLFWLLFRSFRALLCISLMLLVTSCVATMITQWIFGYVHGLTLALGATLIGICIDYFIHGLVQVGSSECSDRIRSIRRIWPALLIGGTSTLVGYTALSLSHFPGLQQVAMFTGSGVVVALLITRYILPDLVSLFDLQIEPRIRLHWLMNATISGGLRYALIGISILGLLASSQRIDFSDNLGSLAPSLKNLVNTDRKIRSRLSSIEPGRFIIVTGDNIDAVLKTAEAVQHQLTILKQQGSLEIFHPLFPWIASTELQQRNARAWNDALDATVQKHWSTALEENGLNSQAFPLLRLAAMATLEPAEVLGSSVEIPLSTQLLEDIDGVTGIIWLGKHDVKALQVGLEGISDVRYFSQKDTIRQLTGEYRRRAQQMLMWGLVTILALLSFRYRSLLTAIQILTPAGVSIMLLLTFWGVSGLPIGILHLVGLLLGAAICVDYGVFFVENCCDSRERTFQAITVSAITTVSAFACLGVAENPALNALAWTVAPSVLLGYLLCPIMLGQLNDID